MIKGNTQFVSARQEWRQNWKIPIVSAFGYAFAFTNLFSLGVLMPEIESETGWQRSQISVGLTIGYIVAIIGAPFLGRFLDRFGPRPIALSGILLYALAFASLSFVGTSIWQWWLLWAAVGLGQVMAASPVWSAAVVALFTKSRGLALAVTLSGTGLSSTIMPKVADYLMSSLGWRGAYLAIGLGGGVLIFVLLWLFFLSDKHHREVYAHESSGNQIPGTDTGAFRKAALSWTFIRMTMVVVIIVLVVMIFMVHFVPILIENGIASGTAASIAGVMGISAMVGRIVAGMMLDRVRASYVGVVVCSFPALTCLIMMTDPGVGLSIVAALLIGLTIGAEYDILAYAVSRYFPLSLFGSLFGIIYAGSALGGAIGPAVGGLVYDLFGSYHHLYVPALVLVVVCAALFGSLGPYPQQLHATCKESDESNLPARSGSV